MTDRSQWKIPRPLAHELNNYLNRLTLSLSLLKSSSVVLKEKYFEVAERSLYELEVFIKTHTEEKDGLVCHPDMTRKK